MSGAPRNALKARLAAGEVTRGCWLSLCSATAAEIAAMAGFDWVLVDAEHAPSEVAGAIHQMRAADVHRCPCAVRVPGHDPSVVKRYLDAGAQTIMFPMVETADQARALVEACLYPPKGRRGVGASNNRASGYSAFADYATTADAELCLVMQVESGAGLEALDEICAVEGVDCVFIGPSDFHADQGFLGSATEPAVMARIEEALSRIRRNGCAAGMLDFDPDGVARWLDAGANMMAVTSDMSEMVAGLRAAAARR